MDSFSIQYPHIIMISFQTIRSDLLTGSVGKGDWDLDRKEKPRPLAMLHAISLLTSTGLSLELGVKALLIAENQLPFLFPMFLLSHFFSNKGKYKSKAKISIKMTSYDPKSENTCRSERLYGWTMFGNVPNTWMITSCACNSAYNGWIQINAS